MSKQERTTLDLNNSVAIVTGASSGIGKATAIQLAGRGTTVVLVARRKDKLEAIAEEIKSFGGKSLVAPLDVTEPNKIQELVQFIINKEKRIDILINNAGYGVYGSVEECSIDDFENQIRVNYLGAVYFTKAVIPAMHKANTSRIIVVSSIYGKMTLPMYSGYCASKFALNAYTHSLRKDLNNTNISVSLVCPGVTDTEFENSIVQRHSRQNIKKRLPTISSEEVANAIIQCIIKPKHEIIIPRIRQLQIYFQLFLPKIYEWYYLKAHNQS